MYSRFTFAIILSLALLCGVAAAQDPTPSPTPSPTPVVEVDMTAQRPMSVREAIALALENNRDIEVTRKNVKIAEFDLQAARGFYQPRLTGRTAYERSTLPNVSVFTANQKTTQSSIVGNAALNAGVGAACTAN